MTKDDLARLKAIAKMAEARSRVAQSVANAARVPVPVEARLLDELVGYIRDMEPLALIARVEELEGIQHYADDLESKCERYQHERDQERYENWKGPMAWAELWKRLAKRRNAQLMWMAKKAAEYAGRTGAAEVTLQAIAKHPDCPESVAKLAREALG